MSYNSYVLNLKIKKPFQRTLIHQKFYNSTNNLSRNAMHVEETQHDKTKQMIVFLNQ